jgi:hypothetical protein
MAVVALVVAVVEVVVVAAVLGSLCDHTHTANTATAVICSSD